jgi:serine/threonine-protein kinase
MASDHDLTDTSATSTGKYRVLSKLGEGGMALVFLAISQGLAGFSKLVVLKVLKSELASQPEYLNGFLREARLSARMNHPNVVAVNEVEMLDGLPVIVMEHLQGQPFSNVLRRILGKEALDIQLRILADSLSGLHYAHELTDFDGTPLRLVHRDFNPQNIFVTYDGSVKVLDFGIAQATRGELHRTSDTVQGKLRYMAPEQVTAVALDRRTDIFAAGVILSELVTGQRFWGELSDSDIVLRLKAGDVPTPRKTMPSCPDELQQICTRALAVRRSDRYQTASEMQRDLEAYLDLHTKRISAQDIGHRLATWFDPEREEAQQFIESHLSNDSYISWSRVTAAASEEPTSRTPSPATATVTVQDLPRRSFANISTPAEKPKRLPARLLQSVGVLVALVSGVLVLQGLSLGSGRSGNPSAGVSAHVAPGSRFEPQVMANAQSVAPVDSVSLFIRALPEAATIFIDDIASTDNPYTRVVPRSNAWHSLRVEATGYKTYERRLQFEERIDATINLEAEAPVAAKPRSRSKQSQTTPASSGTHTLTPTSSTRSSCSPPFTYDQNGVKRFKPECL